MNEIQKIQEIAERVLGAWFDECEIDITDWNGDRKLDMYTCVKAYGDGWRKEYDSEEPDRATLERGAAFDREIRRAIPSLTSVRVIVEGD